MARALVAQRDVGHLAVAKEGTSTIEGLELGVTLSQCAAAWGHCLGIGRTRGALAGMPVVARETFTLSSTAIA